MSERVSNRVFDTVNIILLALFVLICLAPFFHIIAISFSSNRAVTSGDVTLFPVEFSLQAYKSVFSDSSMIRSRLYGHAHIADDGAVHDHDDDCRLSTDKRS